MKRKMVIKITEFTWSQNDVSVFLYFNLKSHSPKNIDIVCTSSYLKVNSNPYIFEEFLCHSINPEKTSSFIKDGEIHFTLSKTSNEEWKSLNVIPENKEKAQLWRLNAIKEFEEREQNRIKIMKETKFNLEQLAVSRQLSVTEEVHNQQNELMKQEQMNFFSESSGKQDPLSKDSRLRLSSLCSEDGSVIVSEGDYDGDDESVYRSSAENIPSMVKAIQLSSVMSQKREMKSSERVSTYPNIRKSSSIKMNLTPHAPNVPKRESLRDSSINEESNEENAAEGSEYLMPEEEKQMLKCEATKCFNTEDFHGSIKAYSKLICLCPVQASYYSNRAASFLALNAYNEAIEDCSKALSLLCPSTEENAKSRLLCHLRRGTSHVRLRHLSAAIRDFESAFRLDPFNVPLAKDIASIRASLNQFTDTGEDTSGNLSNSSGSDCENESRNEVDGHNDEEESQSEISSSSVGVVDGSC